MSGLGCVDVWRSGKKEVLNDDVVKPAQVTQ